MEGLSSSCLLEELSTFAAVVEENISMMSLFHLFLSAKIQYLANIALVFIKNECIHVNDCRVPMVLAIAYSSTTLFCI